MPELQLTPILDLTPLDEESDRSPEREDHSFTPPSLEPEIARPELGKPEVLIEGSTRETIPASLDAPAREAPTRVLDPFSMDEFSRGTPENPQGVATPEERAFTAAQPSEFSRPVIPPGVISAALERSPGAYTLLSALPLPPKGRELVEGFKKGTAEQLSGMTSQESAAMLPAFAVPYVGPALALGMGAKAIGAGAGKTVAGLESGNMREVGSGLSEVGGGALMASAPVLHGGMDIIRPVETLVAKADATAPDALSKSKVALADAVNKTREPAAKEVVTLDQPQQLETEIKKGIPDASAEPIPESVSQQEVRPRVGEETPHGQSRETAGAPPSEVVPTQAEGRAQSGEENQVLLSGPQVIKSIVELSDADAGLLKQKAAVEAGMKLTEADVPALEAARDAAAAEGYTALEVNDNVKSKAAMGRNIYFSGLIEGAKRKGPNYDFLIKEKSAAQPAPVVPARVGAVPENVSAAEPPTSRAGRVEPAAVSAFFERESEAAGLGRSSLPPTVADVRAQRAADARAAEPTVGSADTSFESTPLDPASGAPVAAKVPDTRGSDVKMRKSAERATTSPQIPEPVQERIEAAPESRYTQQSMARVEDAVKAMSDAELSTVPADSNLYVASKLEQADRRFRAGDNDAGYAIFVDLEKQGTSFGQNINQFKRLAATKPEFVATVIDKHLIKAGKDPLTPTQRTEAIEITRKSKEADRALDKSTDAWTKNPTAENAAKAEADLDKSNAEAVELQKFVAKFQPRSTAGVLKSLLQGNLLTPISEVANLFGNMSFLPFRALDRAVGTGLDMIDSALRGKPREISVQPLAGTAEALKGVGRGLKKVPDILIEGTSNVIKGETRAGLHPIKAWINQFSKNPEMPTTGGKITLKDRFNLAIEGTFGVPAEAMLRGLGAGDAPFKEAALARVTSEQLKLANVPRDQWGFAQKFPELFLDKKALDQIHKDTMAAVFQGESKTLNYLTNLAKSKGELLDLVVATVAPYKLTPWNIVSEILSYNPLIALTKGVYDASKGNTRGAKLNAGRMVVGSMLTGTGIWLYKNGLLAPSLDERDEAQKARVLSGKVLPPNHINISGLKRAKAGEDPSFKAGDETVDVFRAGGLAGAMFYMTANIGRDMERGPKATDSDLWMNIIRQSTLEQARFGLNQSFLSGVEGLLTAVKDGNADNYLRQWANTAGSIVLPNTLNTISRATRKYQVDTKADDFKGRIENMVKTKLGFAGLDDYLPLKRDFWGKPMLETPEGRNEIFYHFFDISKNKQVTSDPVELELYRLWRKTSDTSVIPSLPTRNVTFAKTSYALDPQQYERYAELVGENRRDIVDAMVINPQFHKLDDEQKIKILERVYRGGMERGKAQFYLEFNGKLKPKAQRSGFDN